MNLIIATHLGAGEECLYNPICNLPYAKKIEDYDPEKLIINDGFKINVGCIVNNTTITNKRIYNCHFIYLIRNPSESLQSILDSGYSYNGAVKYYCHRLRRIYEMTHFTKKHILLDYEDLSEDNVNNFLGTNIKIHKTSVVKLHDSYLENKYLYYKNKMFGK